MTTSIASRCAVGCAVSIALAVTPHQHRAHAPPAPITTVPRCARQHRARLVTSLSEQKGARATGTATADTR